MDDKIREVVREYCDSDLGQMVLSNSKKPEILKKVTIRPIQLKGGLHFQATEYRGTKVYHENLTAEMLEQKLPEWLDGCMRQMEIHSARAGVTILISKKGKATILARKKKAGAEPTLQAKEENPPSQSHNRAKQYIIQEGIPVPFLVDLGVMTAEGKIINAKYDKFRQINRFLEFIEDILPEFKLEEEISILDFGCGKSYLTFAMYYYLHELKGYQIRVTGLDLKEDVIRHCNVLAEHYGYENLHFLEGDIASYAGCDKVDMVVTLHACDTATDYALKKAVAWGARVILSVPCCQHELNRTLANEMLAPVLKYGILKERIAALITDGLRADLLEQLGYKVQVLEFIDMEHTPKNLLIRAVRRKNQLIPPALKQEKKKSYKQCIEELHVNPAFYREMENEVFKKEK